MTAPAPSRETDAAAIPLWDGAYDESVLQGQGNLWGDPPVPHAEVAARLFAAAGAKVVLDAPCGDGRNLPPLAAAAPVLLAGDTSQRAMAIAERVVERAGVRDQVVFVEVDAFATGLLDASVDGIFCWDLLGHLTDPAGALREFWRILRPGGSLVANQWTMNDCQTSDPLIKEVAPKEYGTQAQYFVGAEGDSVAVYRGINTTVGPVHLFSIVDTSPMKLEDLVQVARQQVQDGIPAENRAAADRIIANLNSQQKPLCPTATPTPAPSPTPAGKPRPTPTVAPSTTPGTPTAPAGSEGTEAPGDEGCRLP